MRDTIILLIVIAALIGWFAWDRPAGDLRPQVKGPRLQPTIAKTKESIHPSKPIRPVRRHQKSSEKLPSIYASKVAKPASKDQKIFHGVPLEDFVLTTQNTLPSEVTEDKPRGVRVFLQCLELKKGKTAQLSQGECNELIARNIPNGKRFGVLGGP